MGRIRVFVVQLFILPILIFSSAATFAETPKSYEDELYDYSADLIKFLRLQFAGHGRVGTKDDYLERFLQLRARMFTELRGKFSVDDLKQYFRSAGLGNIGDDYGPSEIAAATDFARRVHPGDVQKLSHPFSQIIKFLRLEKEILWDALAAYGLPSPSEVDGPYESIGFGEQLQLLESILNTNLVPIIAKSPNVAKHSRKILADAVASVVTEVENPAAKHYLLVVSATLASDTLSESDLEKIRAGLANAIRFLPDDAAGNLREALAKFESPVIHITEAAKVKADDLPLPHGGESLRAIMAIYRKFSPHCNEAIKGEHCGGVFNTFAKFSFERLAEPVESVPGLDRVLLELYVPTSHVISYEHTYLSNSGYSPLGNEAEWMKVLPGCKALMERFADDADAKKSKK